MKKFMTEEEVNKLPKTNDKSHQVGEFYNGLFSSDESKEFKEDMDFMVYIIWFGSFLLKSNIVEKHVCPICGKQELVPYSLGASRLSGTNLFKGYCMNCHTKIAFEDSEYYHKVLDYILLHQNELKNTNEVFVQEA